MVEVTDMDCFWGSLCAIGTVNALNDPARGEKLVRNADPSSKRHECCL